MLKTNNSDSRKVFREYKNANESISDFVDFVYRNYPSEEASQFTKAEWIEIAKKFDITYSGLSKGDLIETIRSQVANYSEHLYPLIE